MPRNHIRYSTAFKLEVIKELENGRFQSCYEARRHYGITGKGTVESWAKKYGKTELVNKIIRVEAVNEIDELKRLKTENRRLKASLADKVIEHELEKTLVGILSERCEISDLESFKKKLATVEPMKQSLELQKLLKKK